MEELQLRKKTEVLLNREVYPDLKKYPNAEKFALCQEIRHCMYRMIRSAEMYSKGLRKDRIKNLIEYDAEKELLLVLLGVAREQRYITERRLLHLQAQVRELGRICGGLMRAEKE